MLPKLKPRDEIRVLALSRSLSIISNEVFSLAKERLEEMGFHVTVSRHAYESDFLDSPSPEARATDIHESFLDRNVKGILTAIGGFTSISVLRHIDFGLIGENPKVFCGYSDITVFHLSFLAKAGMGSYYGPHFSSFGMKKGVEYVVEYFRKAVMERGEYELVPSSFWSDDEWWIDQENRNFIRNEGYWVLMEGDAKGRIIAGNLDTMILLAGTDYFPSLQDSILFIEDDELTNPNQFLRQFQSLVYQKGFDGVMGIVIGRFQKASNMSRKILEKIIEISGIDIPVIANADFGHTMPMATIPVGGRARIEDGRIFLKA